MQDIKAVTLTKREIEVLGMVAQGFANKAIADQLFISAETVKKHCKNCYKKLGVHNKIGALNKVEKKYPF